MTVKDAQMDRNLPDESVPECSEEDPCVLLDKARCNQGTCQKCSDHSHCSQFAGAPYCGPNGRCLGCIMNSHCQNPARSRCNAGSCATCQVDSDCSHFSGTSVCNDGTCVECTAEKDTACTGVCVIEPLTEEQKAFVCDDTLTEKAGGCEPCVSSKHCQNGQVCVPLTSGETEIGNFCQWILAEAPDTTCASVPPYSKVLALTPLEGGDPVDVCTLSLSTCSALGDFGQKDCLSLDDSGDAMCGADGVNDGYCINREGFGPRCTVPCGNADDDCPAGASACTTSENRLELGTQKLCLF